MDELINTENKKQIRQKPPLSVIRIAGEILAAVVTGFAAALLCVFVTGIELSHGVDEGTFDFVLMSFYFAPPLYGLGSAVGVYLVGRIGKQTGSLLAALGGGVLGGILIFIMFPLANRLSEVPIVRLFRAISPLALLVPPIAATIGFNLTRRYKYYILPHVEDMRKSIDESVNTPTKKKSSQKPPLSVLRIAGEILAGMVTATALVYLSLCVIGNAINPSNDMGGLAFLVFGFHVFFPVYVIGSSVGVYLIGSIGRQTGSPLVTLGGGVLGLCVMVMVLLLVRISASSNGLFPMTTRTLVVTEEMVRMIVIFGLSTLSAPIMATLGFNLTRKYKEHKKRTKSSKKRLQIFLMVLAVCSIVPAIMFIGSYGLIIPLILFVLALVFK